MWEKAECEVFKKQRDSQSLPSRQRPSTVPGPETSAAQIKVHNEVSAQI